MAYFYAHCFDEKELEFSARKMSDERLDSVLIQIKNYIIELE